MEPCMKTTHFDLYETKVGWPVTERNAEVRSWEFGLLLDNDSETSDIDSSPTAVPLGPATIYWRPENAEIDVPLSSDKERKESAATSALQSTMVEAPIEKKVKDGATRKREKASRQSLPFFSIMGSVDGIREELAPTLNRADSDNDDDDSWIIRKVVVEVKHRMHRLHEASPPHYEQIQAVVYCFMFDVLDADIVQVLRTKVLGRSEASSTSAAAPTKNAPTIDHPSSENRDTGAQHPIKRVKISSTKAAVPLTEQSSAILNSDESDSNDIEMDAAAAAADSTVVPESDQRDAVESSLIISADDNDQSKKNTERKGQPKTDDSTTTSTCTRLVIHRVCINDPVWCHKQHWTSTLLPRLASFCQAVYRIRGSDDKRYALIHAIASATSSRDRDDEHSDKGQGLDVATPSPWQLLFDECPWLRQCDTAFQRSR